MTKRDDTLRLETAIWLASIVVGALLFIALEPWDWAQLLVLFGVPVAGGELMWRVSSLRKP